MESHVCVFQTVMDLLEAEKQVFVVTDLVASRDPIDKTAALALGCRAIIVTIEMVLFEWVRNTSDESFEVCCIKYTTDQGNESMMSRQVFTPILIAASSVLLISFAIRASFECVSNSDC